MCRRGGGVDRGGPLHATTEDLTGLPPHVVSVCELDPLRDEGLAYHRGTDHHVTLGRDFGCGGR